MGRTPRQTGLEAAADSEFLVYTELGIKALLPVEMACSGAAGTAVETRRKSWADGDSASSENGAVASHAGGEQSVIYDQVTS
jgi:hypothetical protein